MIAVQRTAQPRILAAKGAQWLASLQAVLADPAATKKQKQAAKGRYGHPAVKDALVGTFHRKCAYCESVITHITYGAIEHFRLKSVFPHLTFEWTNLLLSCDICNDAGHKGNQFPLDPQGQSAPD